MNQPAPRPQSNSLEFRYARTRAWSLELIRGLSAEDCQLQSMPDASPLKWHLAHTTWFFETFVLSALPEPPPPLDPRYRVLFNSYYVGVGARHTRAERGLLSRPSLDEVLRYRQHVDQHMLTLLAGQQHEELSELIELGLQHEQQHQELMLTDLKHHFSCNPLHPAWGSNAPELSISNGGNRAPNQYRKFSGGLCEIGAANTDFSYDNEGPRHRVWLEPFQMAERNISNGEFLAFIADGGYQRPELWLSDGWDWVCNNDVRAPLYWLHENQQWRLFTLAGEQSLDHAATLNHVNLYEADAFARWSAARLPTEMEWEHAAQQQPDLDGLFGEVWQWTNSAYLPYPGYQPAAGAVGEYNGKFMINQMVLRGSSCVTPKGHSRNSYRNFFPAATRWQFSGVRLARDL